MGNKLTATRAGVAHFFSCGQTNALVNRGNALVHSNAPGRHKVRSIGHLFGALALKSTPLGLAQNTVSTFKTAQGKYKEMNAVGLQLRFRLTAMGISQQGVNTIMEAVSNPGSHANVMNDLSARDEMLLEQNWLAIKQIAAAQGIPVNDLDDLIRNIEDDIGGGAASI